MSLFPLSSPAQEDMAVFLLATPQDADGLIGEYMDAFFRGFGYGLNNGWYNTAKVHKKLGFEFLITLNNAFVPSEDKFFTLDPSRYSSVSLAPGETDDQLPTFFGPKQPGPLLRFDNPAIGVPVVENSPSGVDLGDALPLDAVPVPMVQAGIGLFMGTDLKVRYAPPIKIEGFKTSLLGFALQHSITQHIPAFGEKAPVDISIIASWADINAELDINDQTSAGGGDITGQNQKGEMDVKAWSVQALVSKKLAVLTLYGGLGWNGYNGDFDLKGTYVITPIVGNPLTLVDPVSVDSSGSNFKATAGARLKFGVFALFADYTYNEYNLLTLGLGVSFREE